MPFTERLRTMPRPIAELALVALVPFLVAGAPMPLPLYVVSEVLLDGNMHRFEAQSFDAKSGMLFIADFAGGRVIVFATRKNRVVKVVRDLPSAHGILVVPQLHRIYVSEPGAYEIAAIDATTYEIVAR